MPNQSFVFQNVSATQGPFNLVGGCYGITVHAGTWGGGSVVLQRRAADNLTYIPVQTFAADGFATLNLPRGTYEVAVTTATGVYADVSPVATANY